MLRCLLEALDLSAYRWLRCRYRDPVSHVRCERWIHPGDAHR